MSMGREFNLEYSFKNIGGLKKGIVRQTQQVLAGDPACICIQ